MKFLHAHHKKGFSYAEILISVAIIAFIITAVGTFLRDVFSLNAYLQGGLSAQFESTRVLKKMVGELRSMSPSGAGAYSIAQAGTSTITFFNDIDNDAQKERVRYFLDNGILKRGVIEPSGNPIVYTGTEQVTTMINYVRNTSTTPLFSYYDAAYAGTTTPLSIPVNILSIRLVKINVIIDQDTNRPPLALTVTSQVSLRNLKDNL